MIVFPGLKFEEGQCLSEDPTHFSTTFLADHKTQDECIDYCLAIPVASGCEYITKIAKNSKTKPCRAYTYAINVRKKKGLYRCLIFEERNNDARARKQKKLHNTPNNGRLTKPYKLIPTTFGRGWGETLFGFSSLND